MIWDTTPSFYVDIGVHISQDSYQCPGRFFGIIGQNPSVSKSNQLHVVTFRPFFTNSRYSSLDVTQQHKSTLLIALGQKKLQDIGKS